MMHILTLSYAAVSWFGNSFVPPFVAATITFIFLYSRHYTKESLLIILSSLSFLYSGLIKAFFRYPRPQVMYTQLPWESYSFPSSHVVYFVAFFGFLIYLAYKLKLLNKYLRRLVVLVSFIAILLVGPSRVFFNAHWPRDVYAGYAFGTAYLCVLILMDRIVTTRSLKKDEKHNK